MNKECKNCTHFDEAPGGDNCLGCYKPDLKALYSENVTVGYYSNFECAHACRTCKYRDLKLSADPCMDCNIRLGNDKWVEGDE